MVGHADPLGDEAAAGVCKVLVYHLAVARGLALEDRHSFCGCLGTIGCLDCGIRSTLWSCDMPVRRLAEAVLHLSTGDEWRDTAGQ